GRSMRFRWTTSPTPTSPGARCGTGCGTIPTPTRYRTRSWTCWPRSRSGCARRGSCWSEMTLIRPTRNSRPSWPRSEPWSTAARLAPRRWRRGRGMLSAERRELEVRQRSLVAALVAGAGPPVGPDGAPGRVQAAALVHKRARAVARAQPELAAALGGEFGPAFHGYAASRPGPAPGCPAADAEEFARYLRRAGQGRGREVRRAASR